MKKARQRFIPWLEQLEDRCLLAWSAIGPAPHLNGDRDLAGNSTEDVTGRVNAIAIGQDNEGNAAMFIGASTGGIWRSTDFTLAQPTWSPRTDFAAQSGNPPFDLASGFGAGGIDVGAITVDPNNPRVIYVGTGSPRNFSNDRYGSGVLKSTDGGNTFSLVSGGPISNGLPSFFRHSIPEIIIDPRTTMARDGRIYSTTLYASVVPWGGNRDSSALRARSL